MQMSGVGSDADDQQRHEDSKATRRAEADTDEGAQKWFHNIQSSSWLWLEHGTHVNSFNHFHGKANTHWRLPCHFSAAGPIATRNSPDHVGYSGRARNSGTGVPGACPKTAP